jgi:hypothetical protein
VNEYPVGSHFYRDQSFTRPIEQEVIPWATGWINRGESPGIQRWRLRTRYFVAKGPQSVDAAVSTSSVVVRIDGVVWPAAEVFGQNHEVILADLKQDDAATERWVYMPEITEDSVVTVSYHTTVQNISTDVNKAVWYRLTTVGSTAENPNEMVESPLDLSPPLSVIQIETTDYIWKEAMRRNMWILQQAGERCKLFVRKTFGQYCVCSLDPRTRVYTGQPTQRCKLCFGTGIMGGYEGPYDIIIGPEDAERKITQGPQGRFLEMQYEVWTGPFPQITQRDFIVKQSNERYSIGPVRRPSARGNYLQQHFQIGYLDTQDIRYQVPIIGTSALAWPETRYTDVVYTGEPGQMRQDYESQPYPVGPSAVTPMTTESPLIPDSREDRGRTPVWQIIQNGGRGT